MGKLNVTLLLAASIAWSASAGAQDWPSKPVKVIVPFGAGSTPDIVARLVADALQQDHKGQSFVVENRAGASGNLGTEAVAKASPDGYTIGISIGGPLAINTLLFSSLRYDPAKDIAPISQLVSQASVLAVNSNVAATTVSELVALIRKQPGKLTYGSIGTGSLSQLAMEAIALKAGAPIVHLPFQGSPPAVTALMRGDVQLACLPAASVSAQAPSGQIRMLAVSTANRSPFLPNLPTLKETGIDVEADAWMGLVAPSGTPAAIIATINQGAARAVHAAGIRAKLAAQMMVPVGGSPEQLKQLMAAEITRWKPVIDAAKVKVN